MPGILAHSPQKHAESEKALRYISQLDDARCAGRWTDVPELCRKVEKHAPHRKCQHARRSHPYGHDS
jgi:hypothetical protein